MGIVDGRCAAPDDAMSIAPRWAQVATALAWCVAVRAGAQGVSPWQGEARMETVAARNTTWDFAAGANVVTGTYVRLGLLAAGGAMRQSTGGADDHETWRTAGRVDAIARFLVDPFRESAHGLYGGGGGSYLFGQHAAGRARMVVVIGYESAAPRSHWIIGGEIGLGGGVRAAMTIRRARREGR
jgi:hypothetical protein